MSDPLRNGFTVGGYRVLPQQNRLEGPSGSHHVEPRVMAVLLALAARPGELVARQTLLDEVWGDVVVLDETLTKSIQVLRGYFDDKPTDPRFIRTVPRRGYELIAPLGELEEPETPQAPVSRAPATSASANADAGAGERSADPSTVQSRRWLIGAAVIMLLALAALLAYRSPDREPVTLAVIPPVSGGDSAGVGFIGEGLADYLIAQLSRNRLLQVVARRSSFAMRDTDANVRAIGEQLGAQYLVEGSLRRENDELLLSLFLVDTESGTNVWTTQLRGDPEAVAALERRSAELLSAALRSHLNITLEAVEAIQPEVSDLAYRKYLEARYQWTLRGERRIDRSIALLEEALAIAPNYAAAHLAYAQSLAVKPFYTDAPIATQFEEARASATRALALDPGLAGNVAALEGFMLFKERRWLEARASLLRALELTPDDVNALYWYSWFLSQVGRYEEALTYLMQAQKLDPVSAVVNDRLAIAYVWVGDLEKAAERYRAAADLGYLESTQPLSLMMFLYQTGQFDALSELLLRLGGDPAWVQPTITALREPEQRQATAAQLDGIAEPDPVLDMVRFGIWMLFGDTDRSFRDFDPSPKSPYAEALWSAEAAHLRDDPRFEGLLEALGFTGEDRSLLMFP